MFHVGRVNDWLNGVDIYPYTSRYRRSAPATTGAYCALDYAGIQARSIKTSSTKALRNVVSRYQGRDVRGRGDRSCIRTSARINNTKKAGIDIAVTSTSPLRRKAHGIMPPLHLWIKIANAGSKRPTPTCTGAGRRTSPRCFATSHGGKKRLGETLLRHRHADDTPAGERPRSARARPQRRTWGPILSS